MRPRVEVIWNASSTYMKMGVLGTSGRTARWRRGVIQDVSDICVRTGVREANGWLIPPRAPLNVRGIRAFMANLSVVRVKDSAGESRSSLMRTRTTDARRRVECSSTKMLQQ